MDDPSIYRKSPATPSCVWHVTVPNHLMDVNLAADKRTVGFVAETVLYEVIGDAVRTLWTAAGGQFRVARTSEVDMFAPGKTNPLQTCMATAAAVAAEMGYGDDNDMGYGDENDMGYGDENDCVKPPAQRFARTSNMGMAAAAAAVAAELGDLDDDDDDDAVDVTTAKAPPPPPPEPPRSMGRFRRRGAFSHDVSTIKLQHEAEDRYKRPIDDVIDKPPPLELDEEDNDESPPTKRAHLETPPKEAPPENNANDNNNHESDSKPPPQRASLSV